jgi:2,3-bisphosphoglycerate-independent phosphoglycerate mutase
VVDVLVIPDGAAQPVRGLEPTALEASWTPELDRLAAEGTVVRVATTAPWLPAGSETGIPALLGATPGERAVGRGRVDAAAHGIDVPDGMIPWRADLTYNNGRRASIRQARDVCAHMRGWAHAIGGHRLVLVAGGRPADRRILGLRLRVWDDGPEPRGRLADDTVVVAARGAAAGCGLLLGARVEVPAGATGDVDTDLQAKLGAVRRAVAAGSARVVIHVGAPDEAAHRRDAEGVIEALERIDAELLGPLRDLVAERGGRLAVCPDHGTDPDSGRHDGAPVPAVVWGAGVSCSGPDAVHERAVRAADLVEPAELLAPLVAA